MADLLFMRDTTSETWCNPDGYKYYRDGPTRICGECNLKIQGGQGRVRWRRTSRSSYFFHVDCFTIYDDRLSAMNGTRHG